MSSGDMSGRQGVEHSGVMVVEARQPRQSWLGVAQQIT